MAKDQESYGSSFDTGTDRSLEDTGPGATWSIGEPYNLSGQRGEGFGFGSGARFERGERVGFDDPRLRGETGWAAADRGSERQACIGEVPVSKAALQEALPDETAIQGFLKALRAAGIEGNPYQFFDDTTDYDDGVLAAWLDRTRDLDSIVEPHPKIGMTMPMITFIPEPSSSYDEAASQFGEVHERVADCARVGVGFLKHVGQADLSWQSLCWYYRSDTLGAVGNWTYNRVSMPNEILSKLSENNWAPLSRFTWYLICCWWYGVETSVSLWDQGAGRSTSTRLADDLEDGLPAHQAAACVPSSNGWDGYYWDRDDPNWSAPSHTAGNGETTYQRYANYFYPTVAVDYRGYEDLEAPSAYYQECGRRKCLGLAAFAQAIGAFFEQFDSFIRSYPWPAGISVMSLTEVLVGLDYSHEVDRGWTPLGDVRARPDEDNEQDTGRDDGIPADIETFPRTPSNQTAPDPSAPFVRGPSLLAVTEAARGEIRDPDVSSAPWWDPFVQEAGDPPSQVAAKELGRFMALLGGPIQDRMQGRMTLRLELVGSEDLASDWESLVGEASDRDLTNDSLPFVVDAVARGLPAELLRWRHFWSGTSSDGDDATEWADAIRDGASTSVWPNWSASRGSSHGARVANLVHDVGLQYFHHTTTDDGYGGDHSYDYLDDFEEWADLAELQQVVSVLRNAGVEHSLAGIAFPACTRNNFVDPSIVIEFGVDPGISFQGTNELYQGAMVVRRLLMAYASGASRSCLYSDFNEPTPWNEPFEKMWSTGLRNDVYVDSSEVMVSPPWYFDATDADGFLQGTHAWRRPAWYALQRMVWLLHQAGSVELRAHPESRDVLIKLTASNGFRHPDDADAEPGDEITVWDEAWIAWRCSIPAGASAPDLGGWFEFELSLGESGEYLVLSLVPEVDLPVQEYSNLDTLNHPDWEDPQWAGNRDDDGGFTTASLFPLSSSYGQYRLRVRVECELPGTYMRDVREAGPGDNPAPVCILTMPRTVVLG